MSLLRKFLLYDPFIRKLHVVSLGHYRRETLLLVIIFFPKMFSCNFNQTEGNPKLLQGPLPLTKSENEFTK